MSHAAAIGEDARVAGYALAGVAVHPAATPAAIVSAWERLAADVACVILTPAARDALGERLRERPDVVSVVLP